MSKKKLNFLCSSLLTLILLTLLTGCRRDTAFDGDDIIVGQTSTPSPSVSDGSPAKGVAATPTPTVIVDTPTPTPTRVPPETTAVYYTVRPGDTLSGIAVAFGTTIDGLMALNGMKNADQLAVGRVLQVALEAQYTGPGTILVPDSEAVYGPGYADFDVAQATAAYPGWFNSYAEVVEGENLTAAEIVQRVAERYSVGPRVLLALLELRGNWLTNADPTPDQRTYPLGYIDGAYWTGLYFQLSIAADALNTGFYGWWMDTLWLVRTRDGTYIQFSADLNAGTAGIQRALAPSAGSYEGWKADLTQFAAVYRQLFGDPFARAVEPLIPAGVSAAELVLPWPKGDTWYFTGGPHPGWGTQGVQSAIDFTTNERNIGCAISQQWVTAAAPGPVVVSQTGVVLQDLDGDAFLGTGWVLLYMHVATNGRVETGTALAVGDRVGRPSCEGGVSNATHLHLARRYNGVWIAADDPRWPMTLSGWVAHADGDDYEGTMTKGADTVTACECWNEINAVWHK